MSPPNSQSPPRTRLRCLYQGPMIRKRDKTKKSTGGRPPRKLLSTRGRGSLIQRPTRYDLYRIKRREALLSAAKDALELEQAELPEESHISNKENMAVPNAADISIEDDFKAITLAKKEVVNPTSGGADSSDTVFKRAIPDDEEMQ